MSVLYLNESQQVVVDLYFTVGVWKYWLQKEFLMRSALYAVLFVYVLSPRVFFLRTGKDYIIDLGNPVLLCVCLKFLHGFFRRAWWMQERF